VDFVRKQCSDLGGDPGRIVLAGWSRGGRAAAGVVMSRDAVPGWRPLALVGIAASYRPRAPTSGSSPLSDLKAGGQDPIPVWLVHGLHDSVVDPGQSLVFIAHWPRRDGHANCDSSRLTTLAP
jgi:predicted esterase